MRYVMRIAELSESSNLWTHIALLGIPGSMLVSVSVTPLTHILLWKTEYWSGLMNFLSGCVFLIFGYEVWSVLETCSYNFFEQKKQWVCNMNSSLFEIEFNIMECIDLYLILIAWCGSSSIEDQCPQVMKRWWNKRMNSMNEIEKMTVIYEAIPNIV